MQYRCFVKAGRLVVGGIAFTTQPSLYELTSGEVSRLTRLYGERLTLDLMEDPEFLDEAQDGAADPEEPVGSAADNQGAGDPDPEASADGHGDGDGDPDPEGSTEPSDPDGSVATESGESHEEPVAAARTSRARGSRAAAADSDGEGNGGEAPGPDSG